MRNGGEPSAGELLRTAGLQGIEGGAEPPLASPNVSHWVAWLLMPNGVRSQPWLGLGSGLDGSPLSGLGPASTSRHWPAK